jgi:Tol biopolymer transport system component/DNA-binding winged helix-turn-helix (wHTH) protein
MAHERKPSFAFGPYLLDVSEQSLTRDGRPVPLTPKLFEVLRLLVEQQGHLLDKETFIEKVWGGGFVEDGALTRSVSMLRKALGDTLPDPTYIETVPKRGYRFVAPVSIRVPEKQRTLVRGMASMAAAFAVVVLVLLAFGLRPPGGPQSASSAGSAHAQITFTGTASAPAISQDGQRVAYIASETPEKRAFVRDLAGGEPVEVFHAPELGYARWSPDDQHLLVWARGAGRKGIYVVSPNGAGPREIARDRFIACWSPDGTLIAVPHFMGGEISLRNMQGVEQRLLSLGGTHWSIFDLDWSPATDRLAVVSNDYHGRYTIWTIQPDGDGQRKILEEAGEITTVRWAPDGETLYYSLRRNQTVALNRVRVPPPGDGAIYSEAVLTGLEAGRAFSISADATRVVYARAPFHSNLWLVELDQRDEHRRPVARQVTSGTSYIERPRISPDGTRVVFTVGHEPRTELYTMPVAGGVWTQLTKLESTNVGAAWSPDGRQIAFASTSGQKPQVWTVDAQGGIPRRRSTAIVSDSFDVAWWAAGIAYQNPGNQNYTLLNPDTGEERPLVPAPADGWIFQPVANDRGQVAMFWNRAGTAGERDGIWVIDPAVRRRQLVRATSAASVYPIGWSASNDAVFVVEGEVGVLREVASRLGETMKDASILKVPVAGGEPQVLARIPFGEIGVVAMTPDARTLLVPVFSSQSDIWLIDGFDPARDAEKGRAKAHLTFVGPARFGTHP